MPLFGTYEIFFIFSNVLTCGGLKKDKLNKPNNKNCDVTCKYVCCIRVDGDERFIWARKWNELNSIWFDYGLSGERAGNDKKKKTKEFALKDSFCQAAFAWISVIFLQNQVFIRFLTLEWIAFFAHINWNHLIKIKIAHTHKLFEIVSWTL